MNSVRLALRRFLWQSLPPGLFDGAPRCCFTCRPVPWLARAPKQTMSSELRVHFFVPVPPALCSNSCAHGLNPLHGTVVCSHPCHGGPFLDRTAGVRCCGPRRYAVASTCERRQSSVSILSPPSNLSLSYISIFDRSLLSYLDRLQFRRGGILLENLTATVEGALTFSYQACYARHAR